MKVWILGLIALVSPLATAAQGVTEVTIDGSNAEVEIEFVGGISADLEISFDEVVGLSASALGLSATTVSPSDLLLLARLPGAGTTIPVGFPVLIEIEPAATSPLSFSGTATVELHTHNLAYTPNSPLRLFKAPLGGDFVDITAFNGQGSYRVGGSTGGFSEFMIAADTRPLTEVIDTKFDLLQDSLDFAECDVPELTTALQDSLNAALNSAAGGYYADAADEIDAFIDLVEAAAGASIPNVWRASRDLTNSAGELIERAATLRFSLGLAASGS